MPERTYDEEIKELIAAQVAATHARRAKKASAYPRGSFPLTFRGKHVCYLSPELREHYYNEYAAAAYNLWFNVSDYERRRRAHRIRLLRLLRAYTRGAAYRSIEPRTNTPLESLATWLAWSAMSDRGRIYAWLTSDASMCENTALTG